MLNELFNIQNRLASTVPLLFKRLLFSAINWNHRLIVITGGRGTGKTTLVLQYFRETYNDVTKCLYISADNPLVLKQGIYETASEYFKYYGDCLIVDEVHKQQDWSVAIKALYDAFPDKKIIVLGSSTLNIMFEKGDLSRRAVIYSLKPLSFREYLGLQFDAELPCLTFQELITNHIAIAGEYSARFPSLLKIFRQFLTSGSFPFFQGLSEDEYLTTLTNIIDKVIYEDITTIKSLKSFSSLKLKKLIAHIATSKIPLFNIESLKSEIGVSKDTLYEYFDLLERAEIVNIVRTESKNIRAMKNSKILFHSPNTYYSIASELWKSDLKIGNIRESFFAGQVSEVYPVFTSKKLDFLVKCGKRWYEIEVGGKSKTRKQLKGVTDGCVFKDGIEIGFAETIPLYLAGFLY